MYENNMVRRIMSGEQAFDVLDDHLYESQEFGGYVLEMDEDETLTVESLESGEVLSICCPDEVDGLLEALTSREASKLADGGKVQILESDARMEDFEEIWDRLVEMVLLEGEDEDDCEDCDDEDEDDEDEDDEDEDDEDEDDEDEEDDDEDDDDED